MTGYIKILKDLDITQDQANFITDSGKVLDFNSNTYYKNKSGINGFGIFASKSITKNEIIGLGSVNNMYKTFLGRYTNHSDNNNAKFYYLANEDIVMVCEKNINKHEEILINYRDHILNKQYLK